jgi:hypothetical protein
VIYVRWRTGQITRERARFKPNTTCGTVACNKALVMAMAGPIDGPCLIGIINVEDPVWLPYGPGTDNPSSQAGGLPQANPKSKMQSAGPLWNTDAATQVKWMRIYTRTTYGSACQALSYRLSHGSY